MGPTDLMGVASTVVGGCAAALGEEWWKIYLLWLWWPYGAGKYCDSYSDYFTL